MKPFALVVVEKHNENGWILDLGGTIDQAESRAAALLAVAKAAEDYRTSCDPGDEFDFQQRLSDAIDALSAVWPDWDKE